MQVSQLRKLLPPRRPGDGRICDWVTPAVNRRPICFIAFQLAYCRDKLAPSTTAPPTESRQQGPRGKQGRDWERPAHQLIVLMMLSSTGFAKHRLVRMVMPRPFLPEDRQHRHVFKDAPFAHPLAKDSFPFHTDLFQHPARRRVSEHVMSMNPVELQSFESKLKDSFCGFGRVSLSPRINPDPKTHFCVAVLLINVLHSDRANQLHVCPGDDGKNDFLALAAAFGVPSDPIPGVLL